MFPNKSGSASRKADCLKASFAWSAFSLVAIVFALACSTWFDKSA
jgi:hypothetical protein